MSYEETARGPVALRHKARRWLADAERLDGAVYAAIANTPTPALDRALGQLTRAADHSKLSLAAAGALAVAGGPTGRRAAARGLASLAVTSVIINAGLKLAAKRPRPDPGTHSVPATRQVRMPISRSFPSGHSAAAFAFATGVGEVSPGARSRCGRSPRSSPTRASIPGSIIPVTWSPVP